MEATLGEVEAEVAWTKYHAAITRFKDKIDTGLVLDIHGFVPRNIDRDYVMLGYLISRYQLRRGDLSTRKSSIGALMRRKGKATLRGASSLGTYLVKEGHAAVPSAQTPYTTLPGYFSGGYTTRTYGSSRGKGNVDAIQIEIPRRFRGSVIAAQAFGRKLAHAVNAFYNKNYL